MKILKLLLNKRSEGAVFMWGCEKVAVSAMASTPCLDEGTIQDRTGSATSSLALHC
jgi:hypothetical protein